MSTDKLRNRVQGLEDRLETGSDCSWAMILECDSTSGESTVINASEAVLHNNPPNTVVYFPKSNRDSMKGNM